MGFYGKEIWTIERLKTIVELARLSNLPTVWSNLLTGLCAGLLVVERDMLAAEPDARLPGDVRLLLSPDFIIAALLLVVFGSCFYVAGMVLNDVADANVDARRAPQRPIPSGRIDRWAALVVSLLLLGLGCAALWPFAPHRERLYALAGLLAVSIVAYNLLHHRSPLAVLFMGACRALLVIIAAAVWGAGGAAWWWVVGPLAGVLFIYTVLITLIARLEHVARQDARRYLSLGMIPLALSPALLLPAELRAWVPSLAAAALVMLWLLAAASMVMSDPPRTKHAVMAWLAGISLLDVWFITLLGRPLIAALAVACFVITVLGHRRVSGT